MWDHRDHRALQINYFFKSLSPTPHSTPQMLEVFFTPPDCLHPAGGLHFHPCTLLILTLWLLVWAGEDISFLQCLMLTLVSVGCLAGLQVIILTWHLLSSWLQAFCQGRWVVASPTQKLITHACQATSRLLHAPSFYQSTTIKSQGPMPI